MNDCRIVTFLSNKFMWELKLFRYFIDFYWGRDVPVTFLGPSLPEGINVEFIKVGDKDWYFSKFSDGLREGLSKISEPFVILLCADIWMDGKVDGKAIQSLVRYAQTHDVFKIHLSSTDGVFHFYMNREIEAWEGLLIYGCEKPHCCLETSLNPAIWNKEKLLALMKPNWTPWAFETHGFASLQSNRPDYNMVVATPGPIHYMHLVREGGTMIEMDLMSPGHVEFVEQNLPDSCQRIRR